ncbi:nucleotide sugar dehydrogenase [Streptomyces sp. 3MP-14]|uniref:Nucleotide sugar dehydrogenase n=1 Tax=Streptomyces mimosae TaxID=2586635 RepID=A0A5N6A092_9ACTN|nr:MULTISPECIES: nucleotide sugar dehydrogenase [Streptomyces]KAB8161256.1 nucleotide sugar dehydrogenase [Streptomyces mimosae]KAB8173058.1 nucleotide sugar dehydrogenase [Streptomyces sp. 3MP-14]
MSREVLAVVGLGYVGLPLAARASEVGLVTVGFDVSATVVAGLNAGRSHVGDVPDATVAAMLSRGFAATGDPGALAGCDTVVICVPTGLDGAGEPDLTALRAAGHTVGGHLRPGTLVVLESTSHPGTTDTLLREILEKESGLRAGDDFHLAYSPERIDPGNPHYTLRNTPKIVSGYTPLCLKHATALYQRLVDRVVLSAGTREAEMAKLLENTHRYVNIALVNEVARYCERAGIDVWDVLHCAGTKPFGYTAFQPGPGVGGHCVPVDPRYLDVHAAEQGFTFELLAAARRVISGMPSRVVERAAVVLRREGRELAGSRVLLLGVSYKPDVADVRESPAFPVATLLRAAGAEVTYHDPLVPAFAPEGVPMTRETDLTDALGRAELAILLQDHACYPARQLAQAPCALLDTRGKTAGARVTLL